MGLIPLTKISADAHVTIHIITSCTFSIILSNLRISVASRDYLCRHGDCPSNNLAGGQSQSNGPECRQLCEERSDCLLYLTTTKQSASHSCYLKNAICETLNVNVQPGVSCDKGSVYDYIIYNNNNNIMVHAESQ